MKPFRQFRLGSLITLLAAMVLVAGCGGSTSSPATDQGPVAEESSGSNSPVEYSGFNPARIFQDTIDGVVSIRTIYSDSGTLGQGGAGGSGFVLNGDGEVITNAHVISQETAEGWKPAGKVFVEFSSGDVLPAKVIGADLFSDVGLLRVDPAAAKMVPLELTDSDKVSVGEPIAVIGSPFGEDQTLTTGIVSQIKRSVRSLTEFEIQDAIQTDASINPGNSGGPMLDSSGRVIAIAQQMKTGSGASSGIGFGVPANAIRRSADQLRETGRARYAYIGVSTEPLYPQLAEKLDLPVPRGAIVARVLEGGPASRAGLKGGDREIEFQGGRYSVGGDLIVSVDGSKVEGPEDLGRIIARKQPGDTVEVEVIRGGKLLKLDLKLEDRPDVLTPG